MGRNTVAALIATGQATNSYNNTGISSNALWIDAFNSALQDLVEDIGLIGSTTIPYVNGTTTYDLPSDYFEVMQVVDSSGYEIYKRQFEIEPFPCFNSYFIKNAGASYQIVFDDRNATEDLTVSYIRYPEVLAVANVSTQLPEVPTIGENALIYYAIARSLRNNNQIGQAMEVDRQYEVERKKIRDAKYRAMAGW